MKYMKKSFSSMKPYHSELILDGIILNANESPVEPPKKVVDEIKKAASAIEFNRYPDMDENDLDLAIAKHYGIEKENVTVGVGSDELLDVMFRCTLEVGDIVLGFSPSFSMYNGVPQSGQYPSSPGSSNLSLCSVSSKSPSIISAFSKLLSSSKSMNISASRST
jgi:histidinol-phosphate/aromatic aminotransferase/cobyric acid decarboxylase-like protein